MTITKKEVDLIEKDVLYMFKLYFEKRRRTSMEYDDYIIIQGKAKEYFSQIRKMTK